MILDLEVWSSLDEFDGKYLVSNYGRVRSTFRQKRILSPKRDKDGYEQYCLRKNGSNVYRKGHRLTALIYVKNPSCLDVVNHIDNVKHNNYYKNLEWTTIAGNTQHAFSGFIKTKGKCGSQLTATEFETIVQMYNQNYSYKDIADSISLVCRPDYIGEILSGRRLSELSGITSDLRRKIVR